MIKPTTSEERGLQFSYEPAPRDIVTIEGIKYAGELFRSFGIAPIGTLLRIDKREDGVLTVFRFPNEEPASNGKTNDGTPVPHYLTEWIIDSVGEAHLPGRQFRAMLRERQQLLVALRFVADNSKDPDSKMIAQRALEYFVQP